MKNERSYDGVLRMCEHAVKNGQETIDLTCLWKFTEGCDNNSLANTLCKAKQVIEHYLPGISVRYSTTEQDEIYAELTGVLKQSLVQQYLKDQIEQRNKDLSFKQLQKLYNAEPLWLRKTKGFIAYIKDMLRKLKETVCGFTFSINKHKQKIYLQYA
jgi:hypothetical protein